MSNQIVKIENSSIHQFSGQLHHTIEIINHDGMNVVLNIESRATGLLFINLYGFGVLNLNINFDDESQVNYLIMDRSDEQLAINEMVTLNKDVSVKANYGEFSKGIHQKNTTFLLNKEHAYLDVRSATLAFGVADWNMNALHRASDTYAMLRNYGVVFENGKLGFQVLGDIAKGYSRSKTHQETRVLNMASTVKATVYPQLIIDENDVEASHAASVGQPDPEAIYYLQSRGLTYDQAIQQLTLGYLIPIVDVIDDEAIKENLLNEIASKVFQ